MKSGKGAQALVIQNVAIEGVGILGPAMREAGWELDTRLMEGGNGYLPPTLSGYQALIVLGGPMNVYETDTYPYLQQVDELVAQGLETGIPMLGLCLGAQLLAKNLGASVVRNPVKEIGWYSVQLTEAGTGSPLFAGLPERFPVFQWHGDRFHIPQGAMHLATAPDCAEQAFSYNDRVFGLQFHLEVPTEMISTWLDVYHDEIVEFGGPTAAEGIMHDTRNLEMAHYRRARQLAQNWLAICNR
ncbi:MAG: type 1 glutamine amidotransferase [Candidatus Desulforudis sp.]|nr:type 1 glutamine amidotransferase [Desulforudis sp.]